MKKSEIFLIRLLDECFKGKISFKQTELAKRFKVSLGLVNKIVKKISSIGAVEIKRFGFDVVEIKKVLLYACVNRNLKKDLLFSFHADLPVKEIESRMPPQVTFTAYSAYRFYFNEAPANYSEVYV